jgi:hypothetical protein
VFYTVIGHADDWRKRSRHPEYLTTDDTGRKSGDLVIARDRMIEGDQTFEARGTEEAEEISNDR